MGKLLISKYVSADRIKFIESHKKEDVLKELWQLMKDSDNIQNPDTLLKEFLKREKIMSTGLGAGIAIPHAKIDSVNDFVVSIGVSKKGIDFDSLDKSPVYIVIMIAVPAHKHDEYLRILSKIVLKLKNEDFRNLFINAKTSDEVYNLILKK